MSYNHENLDILQNQLVQKSVNQKIVLDHKMYTTSNVT